MAWPGGPTDALELNPLGQAFGGGEAPGAKPRIGEGVGWERTCHFEPKLFDNGGAQGGGTRDNAHCGAVLEGLVAKHGRRGTRNKHVKWSGRWW